MIVMGVVRLDSEMFHLGGCICRIYSIYMYWYTSSMPRIVQELVRGIYVRINLRRYDEPSFGYRNRYVLTDRPV